MEWLSHSPNYGVPMLTAEEWTTAVQLSLSVDRHAFTALARRDAKCACCADKTHSDAACGLVVDDVLNRFAPAMWESTVEACGSAAGFALGGRG